MNIRQLKSFVTVCKIGNISRASEVLHVSQPALSRQIQELEREFDCQLFVREKRKIELTEVGYLFLLRAQEMLDIAERTKREVLNSQSDLAGQIRVGCVESYAAKVFLEVVSPWLKEHTGVELDLYSADGDDIRRNLDEDKLDFAVVLDPIEVAKYDSIAFPGKDRWGAVVREGERLEGQTTFEAHDFERFPVILTRRRIVRDNIAAWFSIDPKQIRTRISHNLPSNALLLVELGFGAMICVEGSYSNRPVPGLCFLPFSPERICTHRVIRKKNRPQPKVCENFWTVLSDLCAEASASEA